MFGCVLRIEVQYSIGTMTGTPDTVTAVARYYLTICSFNGNEFGIMIKYPCSSVQYIRNESI